jgi:hypothetical protein
MSADFATASGMALKESAIAASSTISKSSDFVQFVA